MKIIAQKDKPAPSLIIPDAKTNSAPITIYIVGAYNQRRPFALFGHNFNLLAPNFGTDTLVTKKSITSYVQPLMKSAYEPFKTKSIEVYSNDLSQFDEPMYHVCYDANNQSLKTLIVIKYDKIQKHDIGWKYVIKQPLIIDGNSYITSNVLTKNELRFVFNIDGELSFKYTSLSHLKLYIENTSPAAQTVNLFGSYKNLIETNYGNVQDVNITPQIENVNYIQILNQIMAQPCLIEEIAIQCESEQQTHQALGFEIDYANGNMEYHPVTPNKPFKMDDGVRYRSEITQQQFGLCGKGEFKFAILPKTKLEFIINP